MSETDIHVVTVAYNPGTELDVMLASLPEAAPGCRIRIDIVDNGQDPAIVDTTARKHHARVIRPGANLGYGGAANLGFADSHADWFVLVNPDTVFAPGALTTLIEAADRHPSAGVFGPQLRNTDGSVYPSARRLPSLTNGIGHALLATVWPNNPWTRNYHGSTDNEHSCGWLSGACLVMKPVAFRALGGFDPSYFMFFEDVDLGRRMKERGWTSVYVPSAVVTHEQGVSWKERPAPMITAHHESASRYISAAYPGPLNAPIRTLILAGLKARAKWMTR